MYRFALPSEVKQSVSLLFSGSPKEPWRSPEDLTHSMYAYALAAPAMYTTVKWSGSEKGGGQETERDRGGGGVVCGCKVGAVGAMVESPQPRPANCAAY